MKLRHIIAIVFFLSPCFVCPIVGQTITDNDRLEMAIDYFQSGKYHEALSIFETLERNHKLNPRYLAYMGLCYYNEWDFEKACKFFERALPDLQKFSPRELSVYYYSSAESFFALEKYEESLPYYEKALSVCYDNEKGDILFKMGYCFVLQEEWSRSIEHLQQAQHYYHNYRDTTDLTPRLKQIENMISGCQEKLVKQIIADFRFRLNSKKSD